MSKIIQYYNKINTLTSPKTIEMRRRIRTLQDEFMTFSWGGYDAFENFGAFIINDKKGSLKFYNGPGFSNEYSKPQFDASAGDLQGVSFNKQTISFTIGIYWFNIKQYRLFLDWLSPLKIDYLMFGFNPDYRYNVKLSKLGDSTKWVVGKEVILENNNTKYEKMYYTEIPLTFEIQGTPCAIGVNPYEFTNWTNNTNLSSNRIKVLNSQLKTTTNNNTPINWIESDLSTPFEIDLPFKLFEPDTTITEDLIYHIEFFVELYNESNNLLESVLLFNVEFQKLNITTQGKGDDALILNIRYNSETGLLFLTYGNTTEKLLNLTNITATGEKIVRAYTSNKFLLPGVFLDPNFSLTNVKFKLALSKSILSNDSTYTVTDNFCSKLEDSVIKCYPRTNVL